VPFDNKINAGSHAGYPFGFESIATDNDVLYFKRRELVKDLLRL
jgi:hypothetical protein